jgi:ATP-dependent Clp protease adaptor protein ClpS
VTAGPTLPLSALQRGGYKPELVVEEKPEDEARRKKPVEVRLHNDDFTPAEYVVRVLEDVFKLALWKATYVMMRAHLAGQATVGTWPLAKAEKMVRAAEDRARADGWPLRFSISEGSSGG